jgi:threonine dehydratase
MFRSHPAPCPSPSPASKKRRQFEQLQFTASFKERGALNKLRTLDARQRRAGVIAASAGNHAQAVAYHAQRLGVPATIVMPRRTPGVKIEHTRAYGAEIILHGEMFDEARQHGMALAEERGLAWIAPYDDELIVAGQGTIALEMLEAEPGLEILIVPVGGGGLIAGIATAARAIKPDVEIVGVQTARFPSMYFAVRGRRAVVRRVDDRRRDRGEVARQGHPADRQRAGGRHRARG